MVLLAARGNHARVVQEIPSEEYYMNYKQVKDCDNPLVDGSCPLLGGPYRLPNIWLPMNGTVFTESDYKVQSAAGYVPMPRAFHASAVFQNLLWLTGGRSTPRHNYNTRLTDRLGDVWYSEDGDLWTQVVRLTGDFSVQESDAIQPGPYAPWWSRYGHTLTSFDHDGDGESDAMVLMGGFAPEPMNDVWVTTSDTSHCKPSITVDAKLSRPKRAGDGGCQQEWKFVHYAPWSGRGWHAASVFLGRLFVLGGSPLNNDVWSAEVLVDSSSSSGLQFNWEKHTPLNDSATNTSASIWSPRAGLVGVTQHFPTAVPEGDQALFVISGFGGWPCERYRQQYARRSGCHPHYDGGTRARNDVWVTYDGTSWDRVASNAPWGARAWAAGTVWHSPGNSSRGLSAYSKLNNVKPKIYLTGGVYYGTKFRAYSEKTVSVDQAIDSRVAYLDLWWSHDGKVWNESSYRTGSSRNQDHFSTSEAFLSTVQDEAQYLGKYGHSLTPFKRITSDLSEQPALFFIAGDRVPQTQSANQATAQIAAYSIDVFRTALGSDSDGGRTGIICNTGDTECSGRGTCCHALLNAPSASSASEDTSEDASTTPAPTPSGLYKYPVECEDRDWGGCVCDKGFEGEFCEVEDSVSFAVRDRGGGVVLLKVLLFAAIPLSLALAAVP